jgi:hypothetical protein
MWGWVKHIKLMRKRAGDEKGEKLYFLQKVK